MVQKGYPHSKHVEITLSSAIVKLVHKLHRALATCDLSHGGLSMRRNCHGIESTLLGGLLLLGLATAGCSKDGEGACCALSGACTMTTESACDGVFYGTNSVCVGETCPMGACCDGQTCDVTLPERCKPPSTYEGDGTTCDPNPCAIQPTGACCDASNACTDETQADCAASGGRFLGSVASCDASPDNPCETAGACCAAAGGCDYAADEHDCLVTGGTFQGVGSACDGSCPPVQVEWTDPGQNVPESVGQVTVNAHLSGPWPTPITVPWTVGGTATNPADHDLGPGSLLFQPGSITASVTFSVVDDGDPEGAETVIATLSAPTDGSYALGAQTTHTVTITDDVAPTVQWAAAAQNVPESVGQVTAVVQISMASAVDVTVDYTVGGTATNPDDHNAVNGQVVIPANSMSANVQFNVVDDTAQEPDETVVLTITGVSGGGASPGAQTVHTVTIEDNDGPLTFQPPQPPDGISRTQTLGETRVMWWSAANTYGWWDFVQDIFGSNTDFTGFMDGYLNFDDSGVVYYPTGSTMNLSTLSSSLAMGMATGLFATGATWGSVTAGLQDLWTVAGGSTVHVYRQYDLSQIPPSASSEDYYSLPGGALAQLIYWIPGLPGAAVFDPTNGALYLLGDGGSLLDTQTSLGWLTRGEGAGSWLLAVTNDGDHPGGDPTQSSVYLYDAAGLSIASVWTNPNGTGDFRSASLDQDTTQLVGAAVAVDGYLVVVVDISSGSSCATWYSHADALLDVVVVHAQNALIFSTSAGNLEMWPLAPLMCTP